MRHGPNPFFFLIGLIVVIFGLLILRAALREAGEGSCLSACCLWEMGDSIMDLGCGLMGCGGVVTLALIGIFVGGWLHH